MYQSSGRGESNHDPGPGRMRIMKREGHNRVDGTEEKPSQKKSKLLKNVHKK